MAVTSPASLRTLKREKRIARIPPASIFVKELKNSFEDIGIGAYYYFL